MKTFILAVTTSLFLAFGLNLAYADDYEKAKADLRQQANQLKSTCEELEEKLADKSISAGERIMFMNISKEIMKMSYFVAYHLKNKQIAININEENVLKEMEKFNYPTENPIKLCWQTYNIAKSL